LKENQLLFDYTTHDPSQWEQKVENELNSGGVLECHQQASHLSTRKEKKSISAERNPSTIYVFVKATINHMYNRIYMVSDAS
jgi:hypothetical protein